MSQEIGLTPALCRMARAGLKLGVRDLAQLAGVSPNTVSRLEGGEGTNGATQQVLRAALEKAGAEFVAIEGRGVAVLVKIQSE